ncbi:ribosomal protein L7/L12 C-terminal domain protein [Sulfitobacter phage vB_SupP_AX]|nr:ribosomal protein L7/L12 C-terminal domain protein [Sulfitobacter phage vB_SupP_AX]
MADPRFTSFKEIRDLMDADQKINCIKILRGITGEGLKETKDFFEQEWLPFANGQKLQKKITEDQALLDRISRLEASVANLQRQIQPKMHASEIFGVGPEGG